jgi:hypothetical protein
MTNSKLQVKKLLHLMKFVPLDFRDFHPLVSRSLELSHSIKPIFLTNVNAERLCAIGGKSRLGECFFQLKDTYIVFCLNEIQSLEDGKFYEVSGIKSILDSKKIKVIKHEFSKEATDAFMFFLKDFRAP